MIFLMSRPSLMAVLPLESWHTNRPGQADVSLGWSFGSRRFLHTAGNHLNPQPESCKGGPGGSRGPILNSVTPTARYVGGSGPSSKSLSLPRTGSSVIVFSQVSVAASAKLLSCKRAAPALKREVAAIFLGGNEW